MRSPGSAEVHVWAAPRDLPPRRVTALWETLSGAERARAAGLGAERERARFVAARGTLRGVLGRYLGRPPAGLVLGAGARGKPMVAGGRGPDPLRFNLSHAGGLMVLAVAWGREVGVDTERLGPDIDARALARVALTGAERAALAALAPAARATALLRAWTRKEAVMKATGLGAALAPDRVEVGLGGAAGPVRIAGLGGGDARWMLCDLDPGGPYVAAVAAEGEGWIAVLRPWEGGSCAPA